MIALGDFTSHGKEILMDGRHFGDAINDEAAQLICQALRLISDHYVFSSFLAGNLSEPQPRSRSNVPLPASASLSQDRPRTDAN